MQLITVSEGIQKKIVSDSPDVCILTPSSWISPLTTMQINTEILF